MGHAPVLWLVPLLLQVPLPPCSLAPADPRAISDCEPRTAFFAQFGDLDQSYNAAVGSPDRWVPTYYDGRPPCVQDLYPDGECADTDNPRSPANRYCPFVLRGYRAFEVGAVRSALLRADFYYQDERIIDGVNFNFMDAAHCKLVPDASIEVCAPVKRKLTQMGRTQARWVSVTVDLVSGALSACAIDTLGNPVSGEDYGRIGMVPPERCRLILETASDGDLHGVFVGARLSFLSLSGTVKEPSRLLQAPPRALSVVSGCTEKGTIDDVAQLDGACLALGVASSQGKRSLACEAEFTLPPEAARRVGTLEVVLIGGARGKDVELCVQLYNHARGVYEEIGTLLVARGLTQRSGVCASFPDRFLSAEGVVKARLSSRQVIHFDSSLVTARPAINVDVLQLNAHVREP